VIANATKRTVCSGEVRLAVVEAGDPARPTIVLVHGYPDTKAIWDPVLARLHGDFHVVAYDIRGAGESSAPRGSAAYDVARLGDDLRSVIAAVSPDRPVHLVGHDWGGVAGWEMVPRFEQLIGSFTTIAGPSLKQVSLGVREQLRRGRVLEAVRRLRRSWYVLALCAPGVPALIWRSALGRDRWRRRLETIEGIAVDESHPAPTLADDAVHGANLYRRNILWRLGRRGRPEVLRVPVQLIIPSADRFISEKYYERAEEFAPALRRRTVPGSHWAPRAQPELVVDLIRVFVQAVERG
jgi:pimeloyl-ACP methyl ester carboxylesterase